MKVYFNKYPSWLQSKSGTLQAVLLFGSDRTTLDYCQEETIEHVKNQQTSIFVSRYTQTQILENIELIQNELIPDLFSNRFSLIIIDECSDKLISIINKSSFFSSNAFFIFKGLGLRTTSKLVKYFEDHSSIACVGCYTPDHDYIRSVIQRKFLSKSRAINQNALELLVQKYDFQESLALTEKLFLYKNADDAVILEDIEKFMGQEPTFHLDKFTEILLNRLTPSFSNIPTDFLTENFLPLIRSLVYRLKRLLIVLQQLQKGIALEKALSSLTPAVLFFQKESFCEQLKKWSILDILQRLETLYNAELLFKKGFPPVTIEKELLNVF